MDTYKKRTQSSARDTLKAFQFTVSIWFCLTWTVTQQLLTLVSMPPSPLYKSSLLLVRRNQRLQRCFCVV